MLPMYLAWSQSEVITTSLRGAIQLRIHAICLLYTYMPVTRYEQDTGSGLFVLHPTITMATHTLVVLEYVRMYIHTYICM